MASMKPCIRWDCQDGKVPCEKCEGKGKIMHYAWGVSWSMCSDCHSSGKKDCPECEGRGQVPA
jgi:DnaJ-class molecular chaperone